MKFTKMQGIGNDYVYVNCFEESIKNPAEVSKFVSDRHFAIGSDGMVLICPSEKGDFRMRMFNMDGSEGEMCGNAVRCIGKYVYERGMTTKNVITLETLGGIKTLQLHIQNDIVIAVTADMGEPILEAAQIPVISDKMPVIGEKLQILDKNFDVTCVSMGNPHGVIFVDDTEHFEVEKYGKVAEVHPMFPKKANIEFAHVIDRTHMSMRVWERGSGETMACGTGASATLVAAVLNGLCDRKVRIQLLGGTLEIEWRESDNHVYMTGPARFSFDGIWLR